MLLLQLLLSNHLLPLPLLSKLLAVVAAACCGCGCCDLAHMSFFRVVRGALRRMLFFKERKRRNGGVEERGRRGGTHKDEETEGKEGASAQHVCAPEQEGVDGD